MVSAFFTSSVPIPVPPVQRDQLGAHAPSQRPACCRDVAKAMGGATCSAEGRRNPIRLLLEGILARGRTRHATDFVATATQYDSRARVPKGCCTKSVLFSTFLSSA